MRQDVASAEGDFTAEIAEGAEERWALDDSP